MSKDELLLSWRLFRVLIYLGLDGQRRQLVVMMRKHLFVDQPVLISPPVQLLHGRHGLGLVRHDDPSERLVGTQTDQDGKLLHRAPESEDAAHDVVLPVSRRAADVECASLSLLGCVP